MDFASRALDWWRGPCGNEQRGLPLSMKLWASRRIEEKALSPGLERQGLSRQTHVRSGPHVST